MGNRARPESGSKRRRIFGGLLIASLFAALLAIVPGPSTASAAEVSSKGTLGDGYFFVATDGGIFNYGDSEFFGSTGDIKLNQPIVGAEPTPTGEGYWLVASDGGIFTFGDAVFYGSTGDIKLNKPIVAMVATPTGKGYWLFASDGGVFSFGDAQFYGSTGNITLNKPIVGADVSSTGKGYYMVASDGGIFAFSASPSGADAPFYGSTGDMKLNKPIVGMAATDDGSGYYLVASDGGIFSFGKTANDAPFFGSTGDMKLNQPIVGMDLSATNQGYYLVAADGGIFTFGDAQFLGSAGSIKLNKPIVGMAVTPNSPIAAPDFVARLSGAKEVPGPGDSDASGFANIDLTDDEVCWNIKVNNLDTVATAAHIHKGAAGVAGDPVVTLTTPDKNGTSSGCKDIDKALAADMMANPQGYYVNVHTDGFKTGAARGQLKGHTGVAVTATTGTKAKVVTFDTENPASATVLREIDLGGPAPVVGLDFRPGTLDGYFLVQTGGNTLTLIKSDVAGTTTTIGNITLTTAASAFGMDFNPVVDRIRLVTNAGESYRINPDDATVVQDANVPAGMGGVAYTNNVKGATATTLFDINYGNDTLFMQGGPDGVPSPNAGAVTPVGALGFDLSPNFGFDVAPGKVGTALVAGQLTGDAPSSTLLAVDLATGKATNLGRLGTDETNTIQAFAIIA